MSLTDITTKTPSLTAGVDWSEANHAVCVVDGDGEPVERVTVAHSKAGIARMMALFARRQIQAVGIERPDGPVVDALWAAGVTVYVIAPAQIKALRRRYGTAGNKDDRFDAYVLADTVRTDRRRLTPLLRDADATLALRQLCRARKDLIAHRIAVANQLRAHLCIALPAAVGLFTTIDLLISRQFLTRFPTQDAVDWLTPQRLVDWLKSVHYNFRADPDVLYQRITQAPRGATGAHGTALAEITAALCGHPGRYPRTDQHALQTDHRRAGRSPRQAHLRLTTQGRHRTRRPSAGRDRRRPRPFPHRHLTCLPVRYGTVHPVTAATSTRPRRCSMR
jgi:transposase